MENVQPATRSDLVGHDAPGYLLASVRFRSVRHRALFDTIESQKPLHPIVLFHSDGAALLGNSGTFLTAGAQSNRVLLNGGLYNSWRGIY